MMSKVVVSNMVMCGKCQKEMLLIAVDNPDSLESHQFYRCKNCGNKVVVVTTQRIIRDSGELVATR